MNTNIKIKNEHPKPKANICTKLFFAWMIDLYKKGSYRNLNISDLYKTLQCDRSDLLGDKLEENWNEELLKAKCKNTKPNLLKAISKTFLWGYMFWGLLLFIQHVGLRSLQPVILSHLISLFAKNQDDNSIEIYITASLLVLVSTLVIFLMHHTLYGQASIGMRIRVAISSLIYRKTLRLNKKSMNQAAIGNIVNLLANDVTRFDLVILFLHYMWVMPFQVGLITFLIWQQVGISSLSGVILISILSLPVQGYLGKLTSNYRMKVAQRTDYRVTLMSELISGIQVIKMYAWEIPFKHVVKFARLEEVKCLTSASYIRGIYIGFMLFVERAALFASVISFVLLGNQIFAEQVFAMAQFFNLLQLTMAIFYPMSITYGAETLVAIDRIQTFLTMEENQKLVVEKKPDGGVTLKNVNASWTPEKLTLNNVSVDIPKGSLCVIIGAVGSGKSSFLQLLLGELLPESGSIQLEGNISYASQEPWLFNSTIRNNILFGLPFDRNLYEKVIKVCALEKDFQQLPMRDKTIVGERGTSLSGGQKARVNLARAIYRNNEIYCLDDPLSAVDTHVSKHLFNQCILKYLKDKTRILVTHQLQYLKSADLIIVLKDGKIEAQGSYEQISSNLTEILPACDEEAQETEDVDLQTDPYASLLLSLNHIIDSLNFTSSLTSSKKNKEVVKNNPISPLKEYIFASRNYCGISFVVLLFFLSQFVCSATDYWVTFWTQQEAKRTKIMNSTEDVNYSATESVEFYPRIGSSEGSYTYTIPVEDSVPPPLIDTYTAIYIYSGLIVGAIVFVMSRSFLYFYLAMQSSKSLHNKMFSSLLQAPMKFFNINPSGRILNRFSKDIGAIDEILPKVLLESIQITFVMVGILVMVIFSNIYMLIVVIILGLVFLKIRKLFIRSSKNLKHLEGTAKSPMLSHLNSSLLGITTIRSCHIEDLLVKEFDEHQDVHTAAWSLTISCMVSFGLWLDIICVIFIGCTTFSFAILNQYQQVDGSLVGLAISQSLVLTGMLQYGIRQTAEVINQLTSVERILEYTTIEKEGPFETDPYHKPDDNWPNEGKIEIRNLYLQYAIDSSPVLRNVNIVINAGQKIGIVGRTGAGKSSLISAIFRLVEIDGHVIIDGVDTKTLGLHDLRRKISIIPQEPILFSASLRYNLDPFDEYDDEKIWYALEEVEMKDVVENLDVMVASGGKNFSVGQRQLLCLARAILRNNKILILDEATANIDPTTDSLIQTTIRQKFHKCTVLTIAHRLNTIMDSDKVVVMENGEILEYDHPYKLIQNPDSNFNKMVLETGLGMSQQLEELAMDAYLHKSYKKK